MKLYCDKCGTLVADVLPGSRIKRGTVHICRECSKPKTDVPDFLQSIMRGKHG